MKALVEVVQKYCLLILADLKNQFYLIDYQFELNLYWMILLILVALVCAAVAAVVQAIRHKKASAKDVHTDDTIKNTENRNEEQWKDTIYAEIQRAKQI